MVPAVAAARLGGANPHNRFTSGPAIVLFLALAKLLLHLFTAARYGIFRDELYYVACSEHLAWGYVDHPPMTVLLAWLARHVFGHSYNQFARPGVTSTNKQNSAHLRHRLGVAVLTGSPGLPA